VSEALGHRLILKRRLYSVVFENIQPKNWEIFSKEFYSNVTI